MAKGFSERNQGGWKHSIESIEAMRMAKRGLYINEKNPRWRGDSVSYAALHNWVRSHFERSKKCEMCGIPNSLTKAGSSKLQWANKTKKYRRDRTDWMCLCPSCHKKFDLQNKKKHRYEKKT